MRKTIATLFLAALTATAMLACNMGETPEPTVDPAIAEIKLERDIEVAKANANQDVASAQNRAFVAEADLTVDQAAIETNRAAAELNAQQLSLTRSQLDDVRKEMARVEASRADAEAKREKADAALKAAQDELKEYRANEVAREAELKTNLTADIRAELEVGINAREEAAQDLENTLALQNAELTRKEISFSEQLETLQKEKTELQNEYNQLLKDQEALTRERAELTTEVERLVAAQVTEATAAERERLRLAEQSAIARESEASRIIGTRAELNEAIGRYNLHHAGVLEQCGATREAIMSLFNEANDGLEGALNDPDDKSEGLNAIKGTISKMRQLTRNLEDHCLSALQRAGTEQPYSP